MPDEGGREGLVASVERIVLVGFSGTGKTTVAHHLAHRFGWTALDTDKEIERQWGASIPAIFRDHGEAAFRESERAILRDFVAQPRVVVATGGGAVVSDDAWTPDLLGRQGTLVIALDATPEAILERLRRQAQAEGEEVERPMLAGDDPLSRIKQLKSNRQIAYDLAHVTLPTEGVSPGALADEIAEIGSLSAEKPFWLRLEAPSGASEIAIAPGLLTTLGGRARQHWPRGQRAWIVTDENVGPRHGAAAEQALCQAGFLVQTHTVAPGEGSKSLGTAGRLYDWVLNSGIERGDVVIALGGGVVGDLAGFVAATVLRGVGLVQIPTSLLAAVDSSVGGKTGINHAAGKNLIGAFLQPRLVLVDTTFLRTMPSRELRSGWAEVVKHAIIQKSTPGGERGDLEAFLERNVERLRRLEDPALAYLIWRNIGLKAAVVAADEREAGIRAFLNFGHTLGHAIEAADYGLLHGEAIALGMRAAAMIGVDAETCRPTEADRINRLLDLFGLPDSTALDEQLVFRKLGRDKKRAAGRQRFVLPLEGGGVVIDDDIPDLVVSRALASVRAAEPVA